LSNSEHSAVFHLAQGRLFELLLIPHVKRWLESELPLGARVKLLEYLASAADMFGDVAVASIQAAGDTYSEIVAEALAADSPQSHGAAAFSLLTNPEVVSNLLSLNPSIVAASRLCGRQAAAEVNTAVA
jgi:hypothetical protein